MKRVYRNKDITVYWDSEKCIHSTVCMSRLPDVFKPRRRPWIDLQAADAGEIKRVIDTCPSGALTCKLDPGYK
jgi:uncharacterized Fe-S cluster protein YjdI